MKDALEVSGGPARIESGPVRSMTGFAMVRRDTADGEITFSLRSVNHRTLDLHFHGGQEFAVFENDLRELLKGNVRRGHVEVRLVLERRTADGTATTINRTVLGNYLQSFRAIAGELELNYQPDLHALLGLRGVLSDAPAAVTVELPAVRGELMIAAESCVRLLNEHREREGMQLREAMLNDARAIAQGTAEVRAIRAQALPHFQARLQDKLRELLGTSDVSLARLAEEAALLTDRSDIEEELVRLGVHTSELQELLNKGGEVGKRLDFLLQEMNREVNTLLAKSAGAGAPGLRMTTIGLEIKASIERIREQALNLE